MDKKFVETLASKIDIGLTLAEVEDGDRGSHAVTYNETEDRIDVYLMPVKPIKFLRFDLKPGKKYE